MVSDTKREPVTSIVLSVFRDVTPARLRLFLIGNCGLAILFAVLANNTVADHRHALDTVGRFAAPSVVAAHQIQSGIMLMDRGLTDELMSDDDEIEGLMAADFDRGRIIASRNLILAAKNITYGDSEQKPIEAMQLGLGRFLMHAQKARDLDSSGSSEDARGVYRTAYDTVSKDLVPNARALLRANVDALEETYANEKARSALICGLVLLLGIFLICGLTTAHIYMSGKFRRRVNLPLLIAIFLTVAFVQHLYSEVRQSAESLKNAKEDSYDSILAIMTVRSGIYSANAAQSRFMYDRENAADYEREFQSEVDTIAKFTPGHNFASAIAVAQKELADDTQRINIPGLSGALAVEFANLEYDGEAKSALESLLAMNDFLLTDQRMRKLAMEGKEDDARQVCLGYEPTRLKFAFTRLDDSLNRGLKINQEHFEQLIVDANSDLAGLAALSQLFALVIVVLVYTSVTPRLREYL